MLRRSGVNQCPTTPAPITSVTSLYLCPSHANNTGHELPRRSASFIAITARPCTAWQIDLVLQHARGPQNAQQIDALRIAPAPQESAAAPASGSPTRRPVPTSANGRSQMLPPSRPAPSCYPHSPSDRAAQNDSCSRPHSSAAPAARSLRHNQIRRAVTIHIGRNQPARLAAASPHPVPAHGSRPQTSHRPCCGTRAPAAPPSSPQSPPGQSIHRYRYRQPSRPIRARVLQRQFHAFKPPPNMVRPLNIRHSVSPGAPSCVTAISIQPSLL
jgi:hypothetical protein